MAAKSRVAPDTLYTPAEAAAVLRVSERHVRDLIRSGRLRSRRLAGNDQNPRKPRVSAADLHAYVAARPEYAPGPAALPSS